MLNIKTINRTKPIKKSRYNFLRLDKNERISRFQNSFIKKFKSRIKSEHLTCYPELFNFYNSFLYSYSICCERSLTLWCENDNDKNFRRNQKSSTN